MFLKLIVIKWWTSCIWKRISKKLLLLNKHVFPYWLCPIIHIIIMILFTQSPGLRRSLKVTPKCLGFALELALSLFSQVSYSRIVDRAPPPPYRLCFSWFMISKYGVFLKLLVILLDITPTFPIICCNCPYKNISQDW